MVKLKDQVRKGLLHEDAIKSADQLEKEDLERKRKLDPIAEEVKRILVKYEPKMTPF